MGQRITDDHFLLLFNGRSDSITFTMPPKAFGDAWSVRLNTADGLGRPGRRQTVAGAVQACGAGPLGRRALDQQRSRGRAPGGRGPGDQGQRQHRQIELQLGSSNDYSSS